MREAEKEERSEKRERAERESFLPESKNNIKWRKKKEEERVSWKRGGSNLSN